MQRNGGTIFVGDFNADTSSSPYDSIQCQQALVCAIGSTVCSWPGRQTESEARRRGFNPCCGTFTI